MLVWHSSKSRTRLLCNAISLCTVYSYNNWESTKIKYCWNVVYLYYYNWTLNLVRYTFSAALVNLLIAKLSSL